MVSPLVVEEECSEHQKRLLNLEDLLEYCQIMLIGVLPFWSSRGGPGTQPTNAATEPLNAADWLRMLQEGTLSPPFPSSRGGFEVVGTLEGIQPTKALNAADWLRMLQEGTRRCGMSSADEGSEAFPAESTPAADVSTHDVSTASPATTFGEEEVDDTPAVGELRPLQDLREGLRKWIASWPNFKRSERLASNELEEGDELHWKYENDKENTNYFKFAEVRAQSGSLPPPEAYQVEQEGLCALYGSNLWPVDASARLKQLWKDLVQPIFQGSSCNGPQLVLGEQRDGGQDACLKLLAIAWAEEVQVVSLDFDPMYEEGCISCGVANPELVSFELESKSHGELIQSLTKKLLEQCSWQEAWQLDPSSKGEAYMDKVYMKPEDTESSKKKPKKKGKKKVGTL